MRYSVSKNYRKFVADLEAIMNSLDKLSTQQQSFERTIFIEGCFLNMVIVWEEFIEDFFLSGMCGSKTISGAKINPLFRKYKNKDEAFKKLGKEGKNRNDNYLDWLDHETIKKRTQDHFHHRCRIHKLYRDPVPNEMRQIKAIRNYIAHKSKFSRKKLEDEIVKSYNYIPMTNNKDLFLCSTFLLALDRKFSIPFYKRYANFLSKIAKELVK